jgi:two-component system response regulator RegX3
MSTEPPPGFHAVLPTTKGRLRVLQVGAVELELDAHRARVHGTPVHLPEREFQVLHMLMDNAGRIVSRRELLDALWGADHADVHKSIEVHINRLRRRVRTRGSDPIRTVRGIGYVYDLPDLGCSG